MQTSWDFKITIPYNNNQPPSLIKIEQLSFLLNKILRLNFLIRYSEIKLEHKVIQAICHNIHRNTNSLLTLNSSLSPINSNSNRTYKYLGKRGNHFISSFPFNSSSKIHNSFLWMERRIWIHRVALMKSWWCHKVHQVLPLIRWWSLASNRPTTKHVCTHPKVGKPRSTYPSRTLILKFKIHLLNRL